MNVSLVVPVPQDGAERIRNWSWLKERYVRNFPGWELVEGTHAPTPWSKGAVLNDAAARATGDVLVLADADVLVATEALLNALTVLRRGAAWVCPYHRVYRLREAATRLLIAGHWPPAPRPLRAIHLERPVTRGPAGGGIVVVRREDFWRVGGMDERFTGWGGDDISFARALDTLVGPHKRLTHTAWHLAHPTLRPENGRGSPQNERLAGLYLDASGDRVAMAALCAREAVV